MLMIRLSRVGKKHHPVYRVVVSEKTKDTKGDYLELLGTYDPHANAAELKTERIKHWLDHGAQPSGTVHNLLVDNKIISAEKRQVANGKKKRAAADEAGASAPAPAKAAGTATPKETKEPVATEAKSDDVAKAKAEPPKVEKPADAPAGEAAEKK